MLLARVHAKTLGLRQQLGLRQHLVGTELRRLSTLGHLQTPQPFEPMPGNASVVRRVLGISVSELVRLISKSVAFSARE